MTNRIIYLSLLDFAEDITVTAMLSAIGNTLPGFIDYLDVGFIKTHGRKRKHKASLSKCLDIMQGVDLLEWFGGAEDKGDPATDWRSYLLIKNGDNRELLLCADFEQVTFDKLKLLIAELASIGNIGYGYASSGTGGANVIYYAMGITNGYPSNESERRQADKLSAWFRERIPASGRAPPKRYLSRMYRDVFCLNVLNASHINGSGASSIGIGNISELGNGSYLWCVSDDELAIARNELNVLGLLI